MLSRKGDWNMDNIQFGAFVAQLRKEQGLTQRDLADRLHVTDKAVSKWETGRGFPDVKLLEPLAQVLEVSLVELLQGARTEKESLTIGEAGEVLSQVLAEIRAWKSEKKIPLNAELEMIEFVGADAALLETAKDDIMETTKAKAVSIAPQAELTEQVVGVKPVHAKLGPAFKAQAKAIVSAVAAMDPADAASKLADGAIEIDIDGEKVSVGAEFFDLDKRLMLGGRAVETIQVGNVLVVIEQ